MNEIKTGCVYLFNVHNGPTYIILAEQVYPTCVTGKAICHKDKSYGEFTLGRDLKITEASEKHIAHLQRCISVGKYLNNGPKPNQIINTYDIF